MAEMNGLHLVIVPAWWPSPEQPISGIFFQDYARAFAAAGAKVGVIFPDLVSVRHLARSSRVPFRPRLIFDTLEGSTVIASTVEGSGAALPVIRIRGLHTALGCPALQMRRYRAWLRRGLTAYRARHGEPDILHAMCAIPAGWACTHLDDPLARRTVVTEHTGPFALVLSRRAGESYVRAALAKAAAVVAVGEPLRQDMLAVGIEREIAVIGNPVGDEFAPAPPPPIEVDDRGRPRYRALFVGRLTELKGVPELIDAAMALSREAAFAIEWHVAGYGPLEGEMRRRFRQAGLADRLTLHGFCDKSTVARLLREAHFLVLPSHGETFGLAIGEALSVGRPVVTTDAAGCKALVGDGDGVLARIGDAGSLAEAVGRLLSDYAAWDWRAIANRSAARFSAAAICTRYAGIMRKVRAGGDGSAADRTASGA